MKNFLLWYASLFPAVSLSNQKKLVFVPLINIAIIGSNLFKVKINTSDDYFAWNRKNNLKLLLLLLPIIFPFVIASVLVKIIWLTYLTIILMVYAMTIIASLHCIKEQKKYTNKDV